MLLEYSLKNVLCSMLINIKPGQNIPQPLSKKKVGCLENTIRKKKILAILVKNYQHWRTAHRKTRNENAQVQIVDCIFRPNNNLPFLGVFTQCGCKLEQQRS